MSYDPYDDFDEERGSLIGRFLMLLIAGLIATAVFDAFGSHYSKLLNLSYLEPMRLGGAVLTKLLGPELQPIAGVLKGWNLESIQILMHFLIGVLLYPLCYVLLARPIARLMIRGIPWWLLGALYGAVIWAIVYYVIAHFVLGEAPLLSQEGGIPEFVWTNLVGHIFYGLVLAALLRRSGHA